MATLGARTLYLRKALGLTQHELCKIGELSQSNLSLLENDGVFTSVHFFILVKEAYPDINLNWWLAGEGSIFVSKFDDLDEARIDPGIKKFLEEIRTDITHLKINNRLIKKKKKDQ